MIARNGLKLSIALAGLLAFAAMAPANAQITQIMNPDLAYTTGTTEIDFSGAADFTDLPSITDGAVTVSFSSLMNKRTAPGGGWSTWGAPPDTEPTPVPVLYSNGQTSMTLTFSSFFDVFGAEVEPNPFSIHNFNMEFFNGAISLGNVMRSVDGSGGARLLAGSSVTSFNKVIISSSADFAMGRVRYHLPSGAPVPEPGSVALLIGAGVSGVALARRRRK